MHLGLSGFEGTKTIPKTVGSMQTMLFAFLLVTTFIFVECGVFNLVLQTASPFRGLGCLLCHNNKRRLLILALSSSSYCNGYNLQLCNCDAFTFCIEKQFVVPLLVHGKK